MSMQVMEIRMVVVQLAKVASDHNSLGEHAEVLFEQACNKTVAGATF